MTDRREGANHRNNFDAVRLVAAGLVIWGHQFSLMGQPVPLILRSEPGNLGVLLFFGLSGYLVTQSWLRDPHLGRFVARRALRILPGWIAVVLLATFVLGPWVSRLPLADYFAHPATWNYLRTLWFDVQYPLPDVFAGNPMHSTNGSLWTIPLELGCYGVLAALGVAGVLRWRHGAALALLALWAYGSWRYSARYPWKAEWSFWLQFGVAFALGAALAQYRPWWSRHRGASVAAAVGICLGAVALKHPAAALVASAATGGLGVLIGSASTPWLRDVGRHGDISYGLYIYAFPVQQTLIWAFDNRLGLWPALAAGVLITVAVAKLSWHLIEQPALRHKPGGARTT